MNRQTSFNLALIFIIIILAGFLIFSRDSIDINNISRVSKISTAKINQIVIQRIDKPTIKLIKRNNRWIFSEPIKISANPARINTVLGIIQAESYSQLNIMDTDLSALGLHTPDVVLRLNNYTFEFGITDAIDQHRYVRHENKIHLTNDTLYHLLKQDHSFFVDRKLLPDTFLPVMIKLPEYTLEFLDGDWTLSPPGEISQEKITQTVNAWIMAMAANVSTYHPGKTDSTVVIKSENGEITRFDIMDTSAALILSRSDLGIQYQMSKYSTSELLLLKD